MLRLEMSVLINRPVEDVWRVVTNFDNWAKLARSGSEFRQTSEGALGVGATVESRRTILGRSLKLHSIVITEYEPNRTFGMTDKAPGLRRGTERFTFEPVRKGLASRDWSRGSLDGVGCFSRSSLRYCGGSGGTNSRP